MPELTKEEIQAVAREEWARLDREKEQAAQDACQHSRSGTLRMEDRVVVCDDCGKELDLTDDGGYSRKGG